MTGLHSMLPIRRQWEDNLAVADKWADDTESKGHGNHHHRPGVPILMDLPTNKRRAGALITRTTRDRGL